MNARQRRFVAEYLVDLNATQAATRAGYSPKTANREGTRLLSNAVIAAAVSKAAARQLDKADLSAAMVIASIRDQVDGDVRALFDERGNLRPIHTLTKEQAQLITGFDVVKRNLTAGDGATDTIIKVRLADRGRYVELAAKHLGMLVERHEHKVVSEVRALPTDTLTAELEALSRKLGAGVAQKALEDA